MKNTFLLGGILFTSMCFGQSAVSRAAVKKMSAVYDSALLSKERRQSLSTHYTSSRKEKTNILVLSSGAAATREQDVLFIGKLEKKDVYRVDLSAVVSKYTGETEKNLSRVFEKAAASRSILFFDEAEELFGNVKQPDITADRIQALARDKNVLAIFWCEEDCRTWLRKIKHVIVQ